MFNIYKVDFKRTEFNLIHVKFVIFLSKTVLFGPGFVLIAVSGKAKTLEMQYMAKEFENSRLRERQLEASLNQLGAKFDTKEKATGLVGAVQEVVGVAQEVVTLPAKIVTGVIGEVKESCIIS